MMAALFIIQAVTLIGVITMAFAVGDMRDLVEETQRKTQQVFLQVLDLKTYTSRAIAPKSKGRRKP